VRERAVRDLIKVLRDVVFGEKAVRYGQLAAADSGFINLVMDPGEKRATNWERKYNIQGCHILIAA
jgi:hypothetical protein